MILIDTDHLSIVANPQAKGHGALFHRLDQAQEPLAVPVISLEEQCRGWLAKIRHPRDLRQQIAAYQRFEALFHFFQDWNIASWDRKAADCFDQLRGQKIRIGSQELKIAAIALMNDALLLSANLCDFCQVPVLRVENWL